MWHCTFNFFDEHIVQANNRENYRELSEYTYFDSLFIVNCKRTILTFPSHSPHSPWASTLFVWDKKTTSPRQHKHTALYSGNTGILFLTVFRQYGHCCRTVFRQHGHCRTVFRQHRHCRIVFRQHWCCRTVFRLNIGFVGLYSSNTEIVGLYSGNAGILGLSFGNTGIVGLWSVNTDIVGLYSSSTRASLECI